MDFDDSRRGPDVVLPDTPDGEAVSANLDRLRGRSSPISDGRHYPPALQVQISAGVAKLMNPVANPIHVARTRDPRALTEQGQGPNALPAPDPTIPFSGAERKSSPVLKMSGIAPG